MRIGLDMLAVQVPHRGQPGTTIARSSRDLVSALLARADGHEFVLYAHAGLPAEQIPTPSSPRAGLRRLGLDAEEDGLTLSQRIDRLARHNPDALDVLLILNALETWSNYHPPARREGGPRLVALVHDLSPLLQAREDRYDPLLMQQYRALEELKRYDALLATSEATRSGLLRLSDLSPDRIATVDLAVDEGPGASHPPAPSPAAQVMAILEAPPDRMRAVPSTRRAPLRRKPRPRIAFFSPLPPRKSGVSDYSAHLLRELRATYAIDLYHESGYVPAPPFGGGDGDGDFECCDARLFRRRAAVRDYHAVVYQMGNSPYHHFLYETMLRHPGIVTLHDFCLAGFHMMYGHRKGRERGFLRDALIRWHPGQARAIDELLDATPWDREAIARACAERGWFLNRDVVAAARRVVVHSPWCLEQLRAAAPEEAERIEVIPHGIWPRATSDAERAAIRDRFGIPRDALLIASFGFVHPDKMSPEALGVFRSLAASDPSALFVFAGEEADGGAVRRHAEALGLSPRVRFLGRQTLTDFTDLIAATDLGINLRRPPTHGETSGALLHLLAAGVATIVTDVATFNDYPETAVKKIRWDSEGPARLEHAMRTLAADRAARESMGRAAHAYTRERHAWPRVARLYVDAIESSRCLPPLRPAETAAGAA